MNESSINTAAKIAVTVAIAADQLCTSTRTIWRLIAAGELETVRCGRAVRVLIRSLEEFARRGGTAR